MREVWKRGHLRGQGFGLSNTGSPENAAKLVRHSEWTRSVRDLSNNGLHLRNEVAHSPGHALQRTGDKFGKQGQRAARGLFSNADRSACEFPQASPEADRVPQPVNTLDPLIELAVRALSYLPNITAYS